MLRPAPEAPHYFMCDTDALALLLHVQQRPSLAQYIKCNRVLTSVCDEHMTWIRVRVRVRVVKAGDLCEQHERVPSLDFHRNHDVLIEDQRGECNLQKNSAI